MIIQHSFELPMSMPNAHPDAVRQDMQKQQQLTQQRLQDTRDMERDTSTAMERAFDVYSSTKHCVISISHSGWPLASPEGQFAVCGIFDTEGEAIAFRDAHMKYKADGKPTGAPMFSVPCGKRIPLSINPRRLFGNETEAMEEKFNRVVRRYFIKRDLEREQVLSRKGKEDEKQPPVEISPSQKRQAERQIRIHAWEVLQRLDRQIKLVNQKKLVTKDGGEEERKIFQSLTKEEQDMWEKIKARTKTASERDHNDHDQEEKMISLDQFRKQMEHDFEERGIHPASADVIDEEERLNDEKRIKMESSCETKRPNQVPLPNDCGKFIAVSIISDDEKEGEGSGQEPVLMVLDQVAERKEDVPSMLREAGKTVTEEDLIAVRMGTWCCPARIAEDDPDKLFWRKEDIEDMMRSKSKNDMLEFIEKSLAQRPDALPAPSENTENTAQAFFKK